jgi:hypothetical protein
MWIDLVAAWLLDMVDLGHRSGGGYLYPVDDFWVKRCKKNRYTEYSVISVGRAILNLLIDYSTDR